MVDAPGDGLPLVQLGPICGSGALWGTLLSVVQRCAERTLREVL